jgi:hypothetical protein
MTVRVTFECGGCDRQESAYLPHRQFNAFNGKGYGLGVWVNPTIETVVPNGWVYPDPHTGCTYCPDCWAEIEE